MKDVLYWIWYGSWWTPFIGAIYFSVLLSILFGWLWSMRFRRR